MTSTAGLIDLSRTRTMAEVPMNRTLQHAADFGFTVSEPEINWGNMLEREQVENRTEPSLGLVALEEHLRRSAVWVWRAHAESDCDRCDHHGREDDHELPPPHDIEMVTEVEIRISLDAFGLHGGGTRFR